MFIKKAKRKERYTYRHYFTLKEDAAYGSSFECDKDGKVLRQRSKKLFEDTMVNSNYQYEGIKESYNTWVEPGIIKCSCDRELILFGFTNTCDCGKDYNQSGQLLALRSQWGEETGESLGDILMIP